MLDMMMPRTCVHERIVRVDHQVLGAAGPWQGECHGGDAKRFMANGVPGDGAGRVVGAEEVELACGRVRTAREQVSELH